MAILIYSLADTLDDHITAVCQKLCDLADVIIYHELHICRNLGKESSHRARVFLLLTGLLKQPGSFLLQILMFADVFIDQILQLLIFDLIADLLHAVDSHFTSGVAFL